MIKNSAVGKGIILYQSKYGSTKKYAEWLQEETGYDCVETRHASAGLLREYHTIILGGGVYASRIAGLSFLHKNRMDLNDKKVAVFCVGASPYDENAIQQIKTLCLKDRLSNVPLYYCRGAFDLSSMSFKDRTLCKMLQKATASQNPDTYEPWQEALMHAIGQKCDWIDKKYLEPIIAFVQNP